jgi:two-component system, OmpR family, phosphate regulon sensor histidine kinase PhoR
MSPRVDAMSLVSDQYGLYASRFIDWVRRARLILAAAVAVFGALWAFGFIALGPALAGFILIGAAALAMVALATSAREAAAPVVPLAGATEGGLVDAVLSGLPDAVVALDPHGTVMALNARASALAPALRRGEPISLGLRNPEVLDAIRRAGANGEVERAEFVVRTPVECWYEVVAVPVVPVSGGSGRLILTTFHDLTPLRRVEEMRADFVANASHELRTPLAALSGFIDTLRGPARNDSLARDRFLGIMEEQANRMARLIGDLLSLSRIELNEHRRPDAEVDLVAIVRQVIDGLQTLARDREVEVRLSVSAERVIVRGDRDELIRLLENLIENALKYAASGKRLDVTLSQPSGREVSLAVRDYGPGIAPDHLPRLTERFYRVDVGESRAQGGTGLGLALVKHIANRHGGRLTIESVLGKGATFTVHLPVLSSRR